MSFTTLIIQILMIGKEIIIFCPESPQEIFLKEWSQKSKTLFQESTTCVFRNSNHENQPKLNTNYRQYLYQSLLAS